MIKIKFRVNPIFRAVVVLEDIPGATDCFDELSDCFDGLEKGWLPSDEKLPCVVGLRVQTHWTDKIYVAPPKILTKFVSAKFSICQAWAH